MAANQYKVKRVNIAFTDADKDNIQSVRAAHGFRRIRRLSVGRLTYAPTAPTS